ncbi:hypothetical protein ACJA3G_33680, partial [Streptomyces sp. YS-3]
MHSDFVPESVEAQPGKSTGALSRISASLPAPVWDPQQYLHHSSHRTRPFLDLLTRIPALPGSAVTAAADTAVAGGPGTPRVGAQRTPGLHPGPGT